VMSISSGLKRW